MKTRTQVLFPLAGIAASAFLTLLLGTLLPPSNNIKDFGPIEILALVSPVASLLSGLFSFYTIVRTQKKVEQEQERLQALITYHSLSRRFGDLTKLQQTVLPEMLLRKEYTGLKELQDCIEQHGSASDDAIIIATLDDAKTALEKLSGISERAS